MGRAFITGATRGIGRAIAEQLFAEGHQVAICGRSQEQLEELSRVLVDGKRQALGIQLDVQSLEQTNQAIQKAVQAFGGLDYIVCNAGVGGHNPIGDPSTDHWHQVLDTNLTGTFYTCREAVPHLPDDGSGRIVVTSSVLGKFGVPGYTAYCASKHGLIGFTRALALELAPRKITVNAICPGWVNTAMAANGMAETAEVMKISVEEFRRQALQKVPLGVMIEPEEIALLVSYLLSPAAKNLTGQAMSLCGGST